MSNGVSSQPPASPGRLPAYVALGHWRPAPSVLDTRLELLVAQLSAELSACWWCIEEGRHRWRKAALPAPLLGQLRSHRTSPLLSEREAAALALTEAVTRYSERDPLAADAALQLARRYFTEDELPGIARLAAGEHFFDPVTGAVGQDAAGHVGPADTQPTAWRPIPTGVAARGRL